MSFSYPCSFTPTHSQVLSSPLTVVLCLGHQDGVSNACTGPFAVPVRMLWSRPSRLRLIQLRVPNSDNSVLPPPPHPGAQQKPRDWKDA